MRNKLISSLAGAAFSLAASGLAFAQVPPPAPVYSWTGWYAGVNAGASFGHVKTDYNGAPGTVTQIITTVPPGGPITGSATAPIKGFAGSHTVYPSGFMGGAQIGYNLQVSPIWVVGLEADFQGADEKERNTLLANSYAMFVNSTTLSSFHTGSTVLDYQTKIEWFGTARVRVGYVWGDGNVMSYLTGGLAYGKVDLEGTSTLSDSNLGGLTATLAQAFGHSQVNTGWVVGYGTEGRLATPGWTYKIEGLYMDLGHLDAAGPGGSAMNAAPFSGQFGSGTVTNALTAGPVTTHSHFTDGILRAGLNYKFY